MIFIINFTYFCTLNYNYMNTFNYKKSAQLIDYLFVINIRTTNDINF